MKKQMKRTLSIILSLIITFMVVGQNPTYAAAGKKSIKTINYSDSTYRGYVDARNIPSGKGVKKYKNGDMYSGMWKNGYLDGKGAAFETDEDGETSIYVGSFKKSVINGKCVCYLAFDEDYGFRNTLFVNFVNGVRTGPAILRKNWRYDDEDNPCYMRDADDAVYMEDVICNFKDDALVGDIVGININFTDGTNEAGTPTVIGHTVATAEDDYTEFAQIFDALEEDNFDVNTLVPDCLNDKRLFTIYDTSYGNLLKLFK